MTPRNPITVTKAGAKALAGSIEKWRRIVAGTGRDCGPDNCPLCARYNKYSGCGRCPIRQDTGQDYCQATPYDDYYGDYLNPPERVKHAKRELAYLRRLTKRVVVVSRRKKKEKP